MATDEREPDAIERAARAVCMYKTGDPRRVGEYRREAQIAVEAAGVPWQPDYAEKLLRERAEAAEQRVRELGELLHDHEVRLDDRRQRIGELEARENAHIQRAKQAETKLATAVEALRAAVVVAELSVQRPIKLAASVDIHRELRTLAPVLARALTEIGEGERA